MYCTFYVYVKINRIRKHLVLCLCMLIKAAIFGFYLLFIIRIHISYPSPCSSFILLQSAVPPLRSMFSNRIFCFVSLVLLSLVCGQALGYTRRSSGQKYLVKTGNKSPAKHLLVETEDSDYDPDEYDSAEGDIYLSFQKKYYLLYLLFLLF